eukprot:6205148-Pleurochrysis_carterae.AAC.5
MNGSNIPELEFFLLQQRIWRRRHIRPSNRIVCCIPNDGPVLPLHLVAFLLLLSATVATDFAVLCYFTLVFAILLLGASEFVYFCWCHFTGTRRESLH